MLIGSMRVLAPARWPFVRSPVNMPNVKVKRQSFTMPVAGESVPAIFQLPSSDESLPAVLLLHGFSSRKEQMADSIGRALAARRGAVSDNLGRPAPKFHHSSSNSDQQDRVGRPKIHLVQRWIQPRVPHLNRSTGRLLWGGAGCCVDTLAEGDSQGGGRLAPTQAAAAPR